jgi:hypothetical protein
MCAPPIGSEATQSTGISLPDARGRYGFDNSLCPMVADVTHPTQGPWGGVTESRRAAIRWRATPMRRRMNQ